MYTRALRHSFHSLGYVFVDILRFGSRIVYTVTATMKTPRKWVTTYQHVLTLTQRQIERESRFVYKTVTIATTSLCSFLFVDANIIYTSVLARAIWTNITFYVTLVDDATFTLKRYCNSRLFDCARVYLHSLRSFLL